ncbi:MAG: response regulator, partial [Aliifodinibius sp.]|nr:response regulator [Fodinibius sp.]
MDYGINNLMNKFRVILADDHEVVRAGIQKVLEDSTEFTIVSEVEDGDSLFESLERENPDCLLVDISMPEFDPLKAIVDIRNKYPELKILIVSAFDDNHYVQGLFQAGIHGYHLKDQPLSDLKLAIQKVMNGEHWISGSLISKLIPTPSKQVMKTFLTSRQQEILRLLKNGYGNDKIAAELNLSVKTIENHLTKLYKQLGVRSRLEASNYANQFPEILGLKIQKPAKDNLFHQQSNEFSILLVDDNKFYLRQLARVITGIISQSNLYDAKEIEEAVTIAQNVQPKLAFVDVVLGDEDGILCTRRI